MSEITGKRYFIEDADGNKHRVYPAKIKDIPDAVELLDKINLNFLLVNYLMDKIDNTGMIVRDEETGKILKDDANPKALMEIYKKATKQTEEEILEWIDLKSARELLELYTDSSHLKKE